MTANTNGSGLPKVPSIPLTDERTVERALIGEQSIGALVRDATTHLSTLVRAEVELAKAEVKGEVKKGLTGSVFFIVAGVVLLYSSFFLFFMLAEALADLGLYRWLSFAIVFVTMLLIAGVFGFIGYRKVSSLKAPERTISSAKDTMAALTNRSGDHGDARVNGSPRS